MSCSGNCETCSLREACASGGVPDQMREALKDIHDAMENVQHKILVLSGKGGVGKSTVTYLLAKSLSQQYQVGVLDLDLCGPSMPTLFQAEQEPLLDTSFGFQLAQVCDNIGLVSSQFFLDDPDSAVAVRGPVKNSLVLQFLRDVDWEETEFIVVDTPPGTSDEHLSVVSFMKDAGIDGAIIVTTPEEIAIADVRREITFCQRADVKVLGIIENMSQYTCQKCHQTSQIYPKTSGGAEALCQSKNIPLLGKLSIDPALVAGLIGEQFSISETILKEIAQIRENLEKALA